MNENNNDGYRKAGNSNLFLGLAIGIVIGLILGFVGMCVFASVFGISSFKNNATASTTAVYEQQQAEEYNPDNNKASSKETAEESSVEAKEENKAEETTEEAKAEIPESPVKIYEWEENRIYDTDHQATYKGKLYRAKWNNMGNKPDESGEYGAWELLDNNYER